MNWLTRYGVKFGTVLTAFAAFMQMAGVLHGPFVVPVLAVATAICAFLPAPKVSTDINTKTPPPAK